MYDLPTRSGHQDRIRELELSAPSSTSGKAKLANDVVNPAYIMKLENPKGQCSENLGEHVEGPGGRCPLPHASLYPSLPLTVSFTHQQT